jgi:hypothetical protein
MRNCGSGSVILLRTQWGNLLRSLLSSYIFQILRAAAAVGPQAHEEGEHCSRGHQA